MIRNCMLDVYTRCTKGFNFSSGSVVFGFMSLQLMKVRGDTGL